MIQRKIRAEGTPVERQTFKVELQRAGVGAATFYVAPFRVEELFGVKGLMPVAGTVNGFPFRSSLFPRGDGTHYMVVNQEVRAGADVQAGDTVEIMLERDTMPRVVEAPPYLQEALAGDEAAQEQFNALSYSHQKEYVSWIESAKRHDTRARRIQKTLTMLNEGKRLKN